METTDFPRLVVLQAVDGTLQTLHTEHAELELLAAEEGGDGEGKLHSFTCLAYDGKIMRPRLSAPYWGNVIIDLAGARVAAGGKELPVLFLHSQGDPIGHCESVSIDKQIRAAGVLSVPGESRDKVVDGSKNGFRWCISVGMEIEVFERLVENQTATVNGMTVKGPLLIARKGEIKEISFLPIGANGPAASATVKAQPSLSELSKVKPETRAWLLAQGMAEQSIDALNAEQVKHWETLYAQAHPDPKAPPSSTPAENPPADLLAEGRAELAAERKRVVAIQKIGEQYGNPTIVLSAGAEPIDLVAHAIENNWGAEQTELHALRQSRQQAPAIHTTSVAKRATLAAVACGLMLRCGVALDNKFFTTDAAREAGLPGFITAAVNDETRQRAMNGAHEFRHCSLVDLAAHALRIDGRDVPHNRQAMLEASFSTNAITAIFGTSIGARALTSYAELPDTTVGWTTRSTVPDFEQHDRPRLENFESLDHLPPGGEAAHAKRSAKSEMVQAGRYAKQWQIDEQDFLGDNLNLLRTTPQDAGKAAARLIPDLVYYLFLGNPTLVSTGRAWWNTTDVTTNAAGALARATLSTLIAYLMKATEGDSTLNLMPTHLITGAELTDTAIQLCGSALLSNDSGAGSVNPIARYGITPVGDARLSNGVRHPKTKVLAAGSTTNYYLVDANNTPVEVQTVEGTGGVPRVRVSTLTQGKWGLHVDVSHDAGAAIVRPKGAIRGTAS